MLYKTFAQIKQKLQRELDLETEDFIQVDEFQDYVNDGIDVVESEIHKLGLEDEYFLTKGTISLTQGEDEYTLPTDIYANKIRGIVYSKGSTIYPVKRIRSSTMFEDIAVINNYGTSTEYYKYILLNRSASEGVLLQLVPTSYETSTNVLAIWYIRNANRWDTDDTALCDLPEIAMQFLYAYVQWRCLEKEGHPNTMERKQHMQESKTQMVDTLTNMVPDTDSVLEKDFTPYEESN